MLQSQAELILNNYSHTIYIGGFMRLLHSSIQVIIMLFCIFATSSLIAQELSKTVSKKITLQYISPTDLIDADIIKEEKIITYAGDVSIKVNASTNEILLFGSESALQNASTMIEFLDVPPRQIVVEVKIIEVDNQKIKNAGIDWQQILASTNIPFNYSYNRQYSNSVANNGSASFSQTASSDQTNKGNITNFGIANNMKIGDFLNILEGSDVAKVLSIPKIVTINNKKGTILDGSRILYVDKYASYSNLFQTQELKTGLFLSVTPSLGSSGYLKMSVEAKLTTLNNVNNDLRPIEVGQMLENIVVVKQGESIILGGLKKTSTEKIESSVPVLGSILPFLFSTTKDIEVTNDVLIILTPTVVDLTKMAIPDSTNGK